MLSKKIIETFNVQGKKAQEQLLKNIYTGSIENIAKVLYSTLKTKPAPSEAAFNENTIAKVLSLLAGTPITAKISSPEKGNPIGTIQVLTITITRGTVQKGIKVAICINGHAEIFRINSTQ